VPLEHDLISGAIPTVIADELGTINLEIGCAEETDRRDAKLVTQAQDAVLRAGLG
jgi:hypothetical protein